jgi:predicted GNAT family N-acyltransferase
MALPSNWKQWNEENETNLGNQKFGRTICIHSLAVLPDYHKNGVGTNLLNGYIQRVKEAKAADRIALIAEDRLVPFYQGLGFRNVGPSEATFGGIPWNDMVLELKQSASD